jgi:hypothetical protein
MFGKPLSEYIAFAKPVLALIAVVWLLRLGLSMAGVAPGTAQLVSVTGVVLLGALYFGWAVGQKGFGSFKQLYGLNLVQGVFSQTLVALAIVLAIVIGRDNIYTIPEFYPASAGNDPLGMPPDGKSFAHAFAHLVVGAVIFPIVGFLLGSVVLLLTRAKPQRARSSS